MKTEEQAHSPTPSQWLLSPELRAPLDPVEIRQLMAFTERHRLGPLLLAQDSHLELPQNLRKKWKTQSAWTEVCNFIWLEEIQSLHSEFERNQCFALIYKGGAFLQGVYKNLSERNLSDIDLWTKESELSLIRKSLLTLGFEEKTYSNWEAGAGKFLFEKLHQTGLLLQVDLHTKNYSFQDKELFKRPVDFKGLPQFGLFPPPPEEHLLEVIIHGGFQHTFTEFKWMIDVIYFVETQKMDWDYFWKLSSTHKKSRLCETTLKLALSIRPDLNIRFPKQEIIPIKGLDLDFLENSKKKRFRYFLIKHRIQNDPLYSLKYNFFWLKYQVKSLFLKMKKQT